MTRCCGSRKPPHTCCRGGPAVFFFLVSCHWTTLAIGGAEPAGTSAIRHVPSGRGFQGKLRLQRKSFFFWGGEVGKMTELNYDVAFCCISYYMFLLELFSRNCKNTEDRILISLFGRFRDCLSLLKPPEGYSKSVPINV